MLSLLVPVIVEGKYDKARVAQVVEGVILTTDGFGVFRNEEKRALIRRLGERGVILLCDSDGGGKVIRGYLKGVLDAGRVFDLYVPQVRGKEKRKRHGGKDGFLGVEGIDNGTLEALFAGLARTHPELFADSGSTDALPCGGITKADLYELGLTGGPGAAELRDRLCGVLGLPRGMTPNALLSALNLLYTKADVQRALGL